MILDAETLYAFFVRNSQRHWSVAGAVELAVTHEELVVSPFVIVELEKLVRDRVGAEAWPKVLQELGGGAWTIAAVGAAHLTAMSGHVEGGATLAEASVAVLAEGDS